jgi:hypothetical protein
MSGIALSLPEALVLVVVCAVYATFLWINFRAGKYVMLWSSAGIVFIQVVMALGSENIPAYMAAAGFHAALVATIFTATRKYAKTFARETITPRK